MAASCTAARDCEEPHLYPDCLRSMRSIEDCRHGRGIRDTDINNIFNRSQRSRTDSDGAVAGTGLNLAIVKRITIGLTAWFWCICGSCVIFLN
jgi:hypothetical protein